MSKGEFKRDAIAAGSDCQTLYQPVIESLSLEQERSTKSHEMGTKKPFVSCGFVDRLTCQKELKIVHYPQITRLKPQC